MIGCMIRTKFDTPTRRKKPEAALKTKYYYRHGTLRITPVDNSSLGLYAGVYVFIKKYSKDRDQFLIEYGDGELAWTDQVVPVRPSIGGHEIYHTCFEFLRQYNYRAGHQLCYRTCGGFAYLKKEKSAGCPEYMLFINGQLNVDNIPRSFNYCLGYSDNEAVPTENHLDIVETGNDDLI